MECQQKQLLTIQFDPAYKEDLHIRIIDEVLHVAYKEHPHIVSLLCHLTVQQEARKLKIYFFFKVLVVIFYSGMQNKEKPTFGKVPELIYFIINYM